MSTRRKSRRNARKSRKRGQKGGESPPLCLGGSAAVITGLFPDYDTAVRYVKSQYVWDPETAEPKEDTDDPNDKMSVDDMFQPHPDTIAKYYLNKALTQIPVKNFDTANIENDGLKDQEHYIDIKKSWMPVISRASAASKHPRGKVMEQLLFNIMTDFVVKYNKCKNVKNKIESVGSLTKDEKGTPWSGFKIEVSNVNATMPENWEAQNCFLTAGDTSKLGDLEKMALQKVNKQTKKGYILGKILGEIGHAVGSDLAKALNIN